MDRAQLQAVTDWFRRATGWGAGTRLLDIGCGSGYPSLPAAAEIGPAGCVTAIDLSPTMVSVAAERARAAGVPNMHVLEMDAEGLRFASDSYDAITNAYGLMFCPEPARAGREAHRVLRPGGRFAVAAWAEPGASPSSR